MVTVGTRAIVLAKAGQFSESLCTAETGKGHRVTHGNMNLHISPFPPPEQQQTCGLRISPSPGRRCFAKQGDLKLRRYLRLGQRPEPWLKPKSAAGSGIFAELLNSPCVCQGRLCQLRFAIASNAVSLSEMKGKSREFPSLPGSTADARQPTYHSSFLMQVNELKLLSFG